jgi:hypothetical protein
VFAAHALLLAFSLKLKMSAALHQPDKAARQPGERRAPAALPLDMLFSSYLRHRHRAYASRDVQVQQRCSAA